MSQTFFSDELYTAKELFQFQNNLQNFSYEYNALFSLKDPNFSFDPKILEKALYFLYKRHENLRAFFIKDNNGNITRQYV